MTVEELAQIIRIADGNHDLSADDLAERILAAWNTRAASGWQDIATAPKDGTPVDLWTLRGGYSSDRWERYPDMWFAPSLDVWRNAKGDVRIKADLPTHWMPLPEPPK